MDTVKLICTDICAELFKTARNINVEIYAKFEKDRQLITLIFNIMSTLTRTPCNSQWLENIIYEVTTTNNYKSTDYLNVDVVFNDYSYNYSTICSITCDLIVDSSNNTTKYCYFKWYDTSSE